MFDIGIFEFWFVSFARDDAGGFFNLKENREIPNNIAMKAKLVYLTQSFCLTHVSGRILPLLRYSCTKMVVARLFSFFFIEGILFLNIAFFSEIKTFCSHMGM